MSASVPSASGATPAPLAGHRVLVVEDAAIIAAQVARALGEAGATILGPMSTLAAAMDAVSLEASFDAAVIDVDLRGEMAFPLCELLAGRGTRFMLTTGYELSALPEPWSRCKTICKPFTTRELVNATLALLTAPAPVAMAGSPMLGRPFHANGQRWKEAIKNGRNAMMESRVLIGEARELKARQKEAD